MKVAVVCLVVATALAVSASVAPRAVEWVRVPKGTTWALRAWCNGGTCENEPIEGKKMVTLSWYYEDEKLIQSVKAKGQIVTCYLSAGALMPDEVKKNPEVPLGRSVSGWNLKYLDILKQAPVRTFMRKRLQDAAAKGCQALEFDNVDCWQNNCIPTHKPYHPDLKAAQLSYLRWLADTAHGLGMAVGMKNSLYLVEDLVDAYDFAVNEECHSYNECHYLQPFLDRGKAVFGTEYSGSAAEICWEANRLDMTQKYDMNGKGWIDC